MASLPAWTWVRGFCWLLAICNLGLAALGVAFVSRAEVLQSEFFTAEIVRQVGWLAVATGLFFAALNVAMAFLPRKPWVWVAHMINLVVPMLLICPAVLCIPLLVAWLKPETKAYFGIDH